MHELLASKLLYLAPDFLPQLVTDMRQPSSGMFLFGQREEPSKPPYDVQDGVALIRIRGALTQYGGWWTTGYEQIREKVRAALADRSVKAILLDVNSPGGTESGLFELTDWLHSVQGQKPMHAYADGLMCSAAYCIASATGSILAPRMASLGSVGVLWVHTDWSKWNEKEGCNYTYLHAGSFKVAGNPDNPLSDRDRTYFQSRINQGYAAFLSICERCMGLDPARATEWADGQIFHGDKAHSLGLVSAIVRDRDDALAHVLAQLSSTATTAFTENTMDLKDLTLETLQKEHPELHAQLLAQAGGTAQDKPGDGKGTELSAPAGPAPSPETQDAAFNAACAMLEAAGFTQQVESMRKLKAANLSCEQIITVAPMLASAAGAAGATEEKGGKDDPDMSKRLLSALTSSDSMKPVGTHTSHKALTPAQLEAALVSELVDMEV